MAMNQKAREAVKKVGIRNLWQRYLIVSCLRIRYRRNGC